MKLNASGLNEKVMADENSVVLYHADEAIARVTLNRADKRNALNDDVIAGLKNALGQAARSEVRAVVITGAGSDFCSGADLSALQKISAASVVQNLSDARSLMELFILIRALPIPVIAAVRGRALAGGCGLASACDLVLATKSSRFGYPEVKIGFVPAIVMAILRCNVSEKIAFELISTGREITADEAQQFGLINRVFADDTFEGDVTEFAQQYAKTSKSAVALSKQLLYQTDAMSFRDAMQFGVDVNVIARMSKDCRRGVERFLKKV